MNLRDPQAFSLNRRLFLGTSAAAIAAGAPLAANHSSAGNLGIAPFRFDITPPMGHSLCGGWIKPVEGFDDQLEAIGYVITGLEKPIVVCAVDWTGLLNSAHIAWRTALANAAGTTIDRVAVQCVHQHNAPFACLDAEKIVQAQEGLPHIVEPGYFQQCLTRGAEAVRTALKSTLPLTHVATGEARVDRVAGNRRIIGTNGKVISQRGSSSRNPHHHRLPEGLIDPMLKTVSFYSNEKKVVAAHYYACHPMSYYGDGRVSADFCGLARKQRQEEEPGCTHLYFNGCGGNIGAGKYNNGSKEARVELTSRMFDAISESESQLDRTEIKNISWVTEDILPTVDTDRFNEDLLMKQISDSKQRVVSRNRPSYTVAFIRRIAAEIPITLSGLHVNDASILHLPSESFIEYQFRAQSDAPDRFVACAAYGDGGPWYLPTKEAYPQGGYAVSVAWCRPEVDDLLSRGVGTLLAKAKNA